MFAPLRTIPLVILCNVMTDVPLALVLIATKNPLAYLGAWLIFVPFTLASLVIIAPGKGRWGGKIRRGWFSRSYTDEEAREIEVARGFVTLEVSGAGEVIRETWRGFVLTLDDD